MTASVCRALDYVTTNVIILAFTSRVKQVSTQPVSHTLTANLHHLPLFFDCCIPKTKFALEMQTLSWNRQKQFC